jgi:hypothetical protein
MTRILVLALAGLVSLAGVASAQPAPPSGTLLGVYAFPTWHGLRVTGTIPGYSAHGRLCSGDVLKRVTADGIHIYPTRNLWQLEHAKQQIGPYQWASLEVWRPGVGVTYFWVEFQPVGGMAACQLKGSAHKQMKARIMTEREKPGAAALFQQRGKQPGGGPVSPNPPGLTNPGFPGPYPGFPGPGPGNGGGQPFPPLGNNPRSLFHR